MISKYEWHDYAGYLQERLMNLFTTVGDLT